jgi:hypothetical protein
VVRAVERFDANRSSAFRPRRRSANDTRSGVQPRSDAARLLCPRLPSSISASLPSTSFVFRAFVIRQNSSSSYHSTKPTSHPGLSTISFASTPPRYQHCGTIEHIDPIAAAYCIILRDPFSQGSFFDLATSAPPNTSYTHNPRLLSTCLLSGLFPPPSPSRRSVLTKRTRRGLFYRLPTPRLHTNAFLELTSLPLVAVTVVSKPESSLPAVLPKSTRDAQADLSVSPSKMSSTKRCTRRRTMTCLCSTVASQLISRLPTPTSTVDWLHT